MAKVELKKPIVDEIAETIKDAKTLVLVDYRGLTVEQDTRLRKQLREAGVNYKVYKNTFMNFAFKGTDYEGLSNLLEGPSAMAKECPALEVKGGVIEGTVYDAAGIQQISTIPSREELLSKLLGSIQSPITNFARCMKQLAEKGGAAGEEAAPVAEEAPAEAPVAEATEEVAAEAEAPAAE